YDKEVRGSKRSVLTKIQEKDEQNTAYMILCVVQCDSKPVRLLLTDGWREADASLDDELARLVRHAPLHATQRAGQNPGGAALPLNTRAGHKVRVYGAERGKPSAGQTTGLVLTLSANNTRPAEWDATLGWCRGPPFL
ncbi:hypothetical protein T484DRAFT_1836518, partial [Baffinella frigidus]